MPSNPQVQSILEKTRAAGISDEVTFKRLQAKGIDTEGYTPSFAGNTQAVAEDAPKSFSQKLGNTLGSIFGGKVIGDYIGTKIAENSPDAKKLKQDPMIQQKMRESGQDTLFKGPSGKEIAGDVAVIALNFVPFTKTGSAIFKGANTVVGQGVKKFVETAGKKAVINAGFGVAQGAARAAADDQDVFKGALTGAATMGGLSVTGSLIKGALLNQGTKKVAAHIYEWGLGLKKKNLMMEEKLGHKKAALLMEKLGAGTAKQLKEKAQVLYDESEDMLQKTLKTSNAKYRSAEIKSKLVKIIEKQFKNTLDGKQAQELVDSMPLGLLNRKKVVTQVQLNELRREFSRLFVGDNAWLSTQLPQNKTALKSVASAMSEMVKIGNKKLEPQIREIFAEQSAYVTAIKGLENLASTSGGPVNTATALLPGAGGFALGGVPGAIAGLLAQSTVGRTGAAVTLNKITEATKNLSQSESAQLLALLAKIGITAGAVESQE